MWFIGDKERKVLARMLWGSWEDRCVDICYNFRQDMTDQQVDIKREGKVIYPDDLKNIPFISHKLVALINRLFVDVYYAKGAEDFGYHGKICAAIDHMIGSYDGPQMGISYKFIVQTQPYDPWRLYPIESDMYNRVVAVMTLDVEITKENGLRYKLESNLDDFSEYIIGDWTNCKACLLLELYNKIKVNGCICMVDRLECVDEDYNYDSLPESDDE